jgi:hypothetical protein
VQFEPHLSDSLIVDIVPLHIVEYFDFNRIDGSPIDRIRTAGIIEVRGFADQSDPSRGKSQRTTPGQQSLEQTILQVIPL